MYLPDDSDDNSNSPSSSVSEDKKINRPSIGADTTRLVTVETLFNEVIQEEVKDKGTILHEDTYLPSQSNDIGDKTENWNENEDSFGILNISKSKINHMDIFNSSSSEDDEDEDPELMPNNINFLYPNPLINSNSSSEISSLSLSRETKNEEGMETKFSEETSCIGNSLFSNSHNNNAEFESDSKFENNTLNNDFNDNVESKASVKLELDEPCQPVEPSELRNFPELGSDNNLSVDLTISDDEDDEIQLNSSSLYNSERENRFMRVSSGRSRELSSYHLNASYKDYTTFGEIDEIDEKSQLSFISDISAFESADSLDVVSKQSNPISIEVKKNSNNSSNPFHVFPEYDIFQKETNREENKKIVPITKGYREIDINRAICLSKIQIGFHSMFTLLQKRLSEHIGSRKQIHDYFTLVFQYLKIYDSKAKNKKFAIIVLKCISILNMKDGTKSREFSMNPIFSLTERHFEFGLLEYDDYSDLLIDNTYFDIIVENLQIGIKSLFCILNFFELGTDLVSSVDFKLAVAKFKKAIPIFFIAVYHTFHRISLKLIYILNSTLETDFRFSKKRKKIRNLENKLEVERKKFEKLNISKRYVELNQIEFINKRLPFISANCLPTDNLFFNQKKLLKVQPDFADVACNVICNVICACLPPFISYREWRIMCSYILIDYARKAIEIDSKDPRSVEKQAEEKLADLHLRTGSGTVLKRRFLKTNSSEISGSLDILPDSEGILKRVGLRSISESIDDIIHCLKQKKSCCVEFGVKVAIINVTVTLLNCLGVTTVSSSNQFSLNPKFSSSINTQIFDPIPLHNEVIRNEKVLEKFIKFTIPFIKELNLEHSFEKEYEDMSSLISPESFNTDILIKYLMLCKFWITTGLDKKIEAARSSF
ncbi:unnamed protein product [[Candida] boidinii]|uniref:Unnamed protein product n=1 Tax=Candida boidinii TaxID=5477 RepID=A0A9W6T0I8_CANBO|nr:unnamed protein product [[Candida] boidinii]